MRIEHGAHRRRRRAYSARAASTASMVAGIVEHLQQHRLQDAAAPARPEQSPIGHRGHDIARAADRGQPQVGPVALGVAADVHGGGRQPLARG